MTEKDTEKYQHVGTLLFSFIEFVSSDVIALKSRFSRFLNRSSHPPEPVKSAFFLPEQHVSTSLAPAQVHGTARS